MRAKNKIDKKKNLTLSAFLLCTVKTIDSHFVPIPTLRRDDSGIEPCQVGIPTSLDKVRVTTLSRTILEFTRFLLCTEHNCLTHSHRTTPFDAPGKQAF